MPFSNLVRFPSANIQVPQVNFSPIHVQPNYNKARAIQAAFALVPELINEFGPEAQQRKKLQNIEYQLKEQQYKYYLQHPELIGRKASIVDPEIRAANLRRLNAAADKNELGVIKAKKESQAPQSFKETIPQHWNDPTPAPQSSIMPEINAPANWNPDASIYPPPATEQMPSVLNTPMPDNLSMPNVLLDSPTTTPEDYWA